METLQHPLSPHLRGPDLSSSMFYMGNLISSLVKGSETNGRLMIVELHAKVGNEPPPHTHEWENETWYILEGDLEFFCEGKPASLLAHQGDVMFVPAGIAHAVYYRSEKVRAIIITQATGERGVGLDTYFEQLAEPATSMELPRDAITYVLSDPAVAFQIGVQNGTILLSPDEAAARLPYYPGFGANLQPQS